MTVLLVTLTNLLLAGLSLGLGTVKALAARHAREWPLTLTASVLICAGMIFLLQTPAVYRAVGAAVHSPNIVALLFPVLTLVCVAHAHAMVRLWQPHRSARAALHSASLRWGPVYVGAVIALTALYLHADLGEAAPLTFAAVYARVPEVVALHAVYWAALIVTTTVTIRECRSVSIPGRPALASELRSALGWFAVALALNMGNVLLTAAAMIGSAVGPQPLTTVAESAWIGTVASCIAANTALASMVLRSRRAERQDQRTLQPLLDLVTEGENAPAMTGMGENALWPGLNTAFDLNAAMAEIHDGSGRISPWWSLLPSLVVDRLAQSQHGTDAGELGDSWDVTAAHTAATLLVAAQARDARRPALPPHLRLARLPGSDVEPHSERQHLVAVARHLNHPLVREAVALSGQAQASGTL
jgi:hypothetical protein